MVAFMVPGLASICDRVLSARSVVKAFRIKSQTFPTPKTLQTHTHTRTSSLPGFQL